MLPDPLGKTLALDVLHDDEDTIVFFADFVDGADVGWSSAAAALASFISRCRARSLASDRSGSILIATMRPTDVFREEDLTHPARAQLSDDSVMVDL